jgi:hypothetical protein
MILTKPTRYAIRGVLSLAHGVPDQATIRPRYVLREAVLRESMARLRSLPSCRRSVDASTIRMPTCSGPGDRSSLTGVAPVVANDA